MKQRDLNNFWQRVSKDDETGCWIWAGATRGSKHKYGCFYSQGKTVSAHRFSYQIHHGNIPAGGDKRGMCICHRCDNPLCVNPEHLFIGTHRQNMRDKADKGRHHNAAKTHCPNGHKYSDENTYITKTGLRHCKTCHRQKEATRRKKRKLQEETNVNTDSQSR
jgi:hypothetical protein